MHKTKNSSVQISLYSVSPSWILACMSITFSAFMPCFFGLDLQCCLCIFNNCRRCSFEATNILGKRKNKVLKQPLQRRRHFSHLSGGVRIFPLIIFLCFAGSPVAFRHIMKSRLCLLTPFFFFSCLPTRGARSCWCPSHSVGRSAWRATKANGLGWRYCKGG